MRILYLDLDSLRPDHLGCYGYSRATSPNIDRVAADGVRFVACHATDVPCMPSRTSLFSGRFGAHHGCVTHTGTRAEPFAEGPSRRFRPQWGHTGWIRLLRDAGLRTVTFSSFAERHGAWHWYAGFQEIHDTGHFGHEIADHVTPDAASWLDANARSDNWFLHVNLWDVHVPYRTPADFGSPFAGEPLPDPWLTDDIIRAHRSQPGIRSARDALFLHYARHRPDLNPAEIATTADVKRMIDGYDAAVRYADDHVGRILAALDRAGVLRDTAVIISADHGECLGELNAYSGHCFADYCTTRVPLIIRWPGVTDNSAGRADRGLHYHIDLAATVCDLLRINRPDCWDAASFAPALTGGADADREFLVLSQLAQTCQRSVRFADAGRDCFFIRTYRDGYYFLPTDMLFDVAADPHELRDLAPTHPDLVARASALLDRWHREQFPAGPDADPLQAVLRDPADPTLETYLDRLRRSDRATVADALAARYGRR